MNTTPSFDTDFRVKPLETLVRDLPTDLRSEVRNFVEFLLLKRTHITEQFLHQDLSRPQQKNATPLQGTVLRYDEPFAPVTEAEWEALQ